MMRFLSRRSGERIFLFFSLFLLAGIAGCAGKVSYKPPKPEDAPENIREAVLLGRDILADTPKHLPQNVGNDMKCSNCHFNAGVSEGGKGGAISLVGVGAVYPQFRSRQNYAVNMVTRLND